MVSIEAEPFYCQNKEEYISQPVGPDGERSNLFQYVSCIRINGRPILPPVMTTERRREMAGWRELAKEVEQRTRRRSESISSDGISSVISKSTPARPVSLNLERNNTKKRTSKFRQTLEHRLAMDSGTESDTERKRWSPLKVDSVQDLRLHAAGDSDSTQDTPETVTGSPRLLRQNSYTILTPCEALKSSRVSPSCKIDLSPLPVNTSSSGAGATAPQTSGRSDSGRKTWDLQSAQYKWSARAPESDTESESCPNSPSKSCNKPHARPRSVPCAERVPSHSTKNSHAEQARPDTFDPLPSVREQLTSLSDMMIALTLRHEQQRRLLQREQDEERVQYQQMFTFKQRQILDFISNAAGSQLSRPEPESCPTSCVGEKTELPSSRSDGQLATKRRTSSKNGDSKKVTVGPNAKAAKVSSIDTDVDVSLMDDTTAHTKDLEEDSECWSVSSRCSTISNEPVPSSQRNGVARFNYSQNLPLYNKAATIICSHVRGYLTRRLMRTWHVMVLHRSLLDSVNVSRTLSGAKEALGASDVKFMDSLRRQIFSDWDAFYAIFMTKSIPEQMALIRADRDRRLRAPKTSPGSLERRMSSATIKSLQRRKVYKGTSSYQYTTTSISRDVDQVRCKVTNSSTDDDSSYESRNV